MSEIITWETVPDIGGALWVTDAFPGYHIESVEGGYIVWEPDEVIGMVTTFAEAEKLVKADADAKR